MARISSWRSGITRHERLAAKLLQGGLLLLLLAAICLGGYSSLLSHQLASARQQAAELQKSLAQQAGLIATLQTQDAQNRALMAAQQRQERQLRQQHEAYQRKYREAIKTIPAPLSLCLALCLSSCARPPAPQAVPLLPLSRYSRPVSNRSCKGRPGAMR